MPRLLAALTLPLLPLLATGCSAAQAPADQSRSSQQRPVRAASTGTHTWELQRTALYADVPDLNADPAAQRTVHIPQVSLLVPRGWSVKAGLLANGPVTDCAFNEGRLAIAVTSPDQRVALNIIPGQASFWSNNRAVLQQRADFTRKWQGSVACSIEQPQPLAAAFPSAAHLLFKDGVVDGTPTPVPGLSTELANSVSLANQTLSRQGARLEAESAQARITGHSPSGAPMEARLIVLLTHRFDPAPGGGFVELSDSPLFAVELAPEGQLAGNQHLLDTVLNSIQVAPEYTAFTTAFAASLARQRQAAEDRVSQIYAQMAQDNANAARQQASIRNDVSNYRSQVMSSVAQTRAAALHHSSQQFALSMNDQGLFHDGSGHTVQLPNRYDHVWASSTGNTNDYILTDNPSYNPNGNAGSASWTELQPVR